MPGAEFMVVILGDGGVGKSALVIRFVNGTFVKNYDPTIEDSYRHTVMVEQNPYMVEFMDTAGQDEYQCMSEVYIKNGHAFLLVFAVTAKDSVKFVENTLEKIALIKEDVAKVPIVLAANKADMEGDRVISSAEVQELAARLGVQCFETSALANTNVEEAFGALVERLVQLHQNDISTKKKKKVCIIL
mmetsp:Transcript_1768/g.6321  ORF Transcript_1768/g.6321 Transcript_1768/m.6321 type:complete len:188 (+) Transcript_1768:85-648(+)